MSIFYLKKYAYQTCPACACLVGKEDGCDTMSCRCGTRFCFTCGSRSSAGLEAACACARPVLDAETAAVAQAWEWSEGRPRGEHGDSSWAYGYGSSSRELSWDYYDMDLQEYFVEGRYGVETVVVSGNTYFGSVRIPDKASHWNRARTAAKVFVLFIEFSVFVNANCY